MTSRRSHLCSPHPLLHSFLPFTKNEPVTTTIDRYSGSNIVLGLIPRKENTPRHNPLGLVGDSDKDGMKMIFSNLSTFDVKDLTKRLSKDNLSTLKHRESK